MIRGGLEPKRRIKKLEKYHNYCSEHKEALEKSKKCGCFYCLNIYDPKLIKEWIDKGQTALCAKCGIDSVLPSKWVKLNKELLKEMNDYWFSIK